MSSKRSRVRMDTSKAMALLGFSSSKTFEQTEMSEIQMAFMMRVHHLETTLTGHKAGKRDELRRVNEAFQFLRKKQKNFSGRSMHQNWQAVGNKSKVIQAFLQQENNEENDDTDQEVDPEPTKVKNNESKSNYNSKFDKDELGLYAKESSSSSSKNRSYSNKSYSETTKLRSRSSLRTRVRPPPSIKKRRRSSAHLEIRHKMDDVVHTAHSVANLNLCESEGERTRSIESIRLSSGVAEMHVSIPSTVTSGVDNVVYFVVEIDGHEHCWLRYSQLRRLHTTLSGLKPVDVPKNRFLPNFPSKLMMIEKKSLEQRRLGLERFLQRAATLQAHKEMRNELNQFLLQAQREQVGSSQIENERQDRFVVHLSLLKNDRIVNLKEFFIGKNVCKKESCTSEVLQRVCSKLGIAKAFWSHFGLFLCTKASSAEWRMTKRLMDYECPFLTATRHDGRILLRKTCWDPNLDQLLCTDSASCRILVDQTLEDLELFKQEFSKEEKATMSNLKILQSSPTSFLRLAMKGLSRFYSFVAFQNCISDYPLNQTRAEVRLGRQQLVLSNLKHDEIAEGCDDIAFEVTRMRSWRVISGLGSDHRESDGKSLSTCNGDNDVRRESEQLEFSFEYLVDDDRLRWIRLRTQDAILISNALQSMVEELLHLQNVDPMQSVQAEPEIDQSPKNDRAQESTTKEKDGSNDEAVSPEDVCDYSVGRLSSRFESISFLSTRDSAEELFDNQSFMHQRQ